MGLNYEWQGCLCVPSLSWSLEEGIVNIFPVENMKLGLVSEIYEENVSTRIIYLAQKSSWCFEGFGYRSLDWLTRQLNSVKPNKICSGNK